MSNSNVIIVLMVIIPLLIGIGIIWYQLNSSEEQTKLEAQKIIDFRNTDYSCDETAKFYLKFYPKKYNSYTDVNWYWEAKDKLIDNECISSDELHNLEFIDVCMDGKTVGCEISKLENPELYENFNFKKQLLDSISQKYLDEGDGKQ